METLCNVILQVLISQRFTRHRRMLMALLFLVLEATSFALDQIKRNLLGFLVASFVLSVVSFLMTGYIAMGSKTDFERDRIMIELAFSVVQLIMTCLRLLASIFHFKFESTIACIFPLVLAGTNLVLAYRHNELVQHPTPNTQERDEEEGLAGVPAYQINDVTTSDNLSTVVDETPDSRVLLPVTTRSSIMVNEEETATMSKQEEIPEKSRASLILSDTPTMSKDEKIAILTARRSDVDEEIADLTAAPTTPTISFKTKYLEKELIVPTEAMEHFPIPQGQDFIDLLVKDTEGEIHKFRLTIKPKPVLTEGWLEFVKSKAVVPEHIVTFYKQQNEDSRKGVGQPSTNRTIVDFGQRTERFYFQGEGLEMEAVAEVRLQENNLRCELAEKSFLRFELEGKSR